MRPTPVHVCALMLCTAGLPAVAAPPNGIAEPFPIDDPSLLERVVNSGDLNGDGRDDFLMGLCNPSRVEMILSSPDGYGATTLPSGVTPATVAAGDVNADGVPDLIVAGPLGYMFEFRYGLPGGGFGDPFTIRYGYNNPVQTCDAPVRVMVEDVDGDGAAEMVVVGRVQVSLGAGVASVMVVPLGPDGPGEREDAVAGEPWSFTDLSPMSEARLSDVDHDGDSDLVAMVNGRTWLCRMIEGVFAPAEGIAQASWPYPVHADVNGDAMPDRVRMEPSRIAIQLLHPDGSIVPVSVAVPTSGSASVTAIGDVDGDGAEDVLVRSQYSDVLPRVVTGLLGTSPHQALVSSKGYSTTDSRYIPARSAAQAGGMHLIEADGFITHHARARDGSLPDYRTLCLPVVLGNDAVVIDLDGQPGIEYAVMVHSASMTRYYSLDLTGNVLSTNLFERGEIGLLTGDFNNDGWEDLATLGYGGPTSYLDVALGNGAGGLVMLPTVQFAGNPQGWATVIDIESDGRDEIVVVDNTENAASIVRVGDDSTTTVTPFTMEASARYVAAFEATGDGHPDLIITDFSAERVSIIANDGNGGFVPSPVVLLEGFRASAFDSGDVDGDGLADLVMVRSNHTGGAIVWGSPDGSSTPDLLDLPARGSGVRVLDVNEDGTADLFVAGEPGSDSLVAFQTAPRSFGLVGRVSSSFDRVMNQADLNADGAMDLILQHRPASGWSGTLPECGAIVLLGEPSACPADLNGDGLLNVFDLAAYLDLFNSGQPAADLAAPPGVFNFFDVAAYLQAFGAGCP